MCNSVSQIETENQKVLLIKSIMVFSFGVAHPIAEPFSKGFNLTKRKKEPKNKSNIVSTLYLGHWCTNLQTNEDTRRKNGFSNNQCIGKLPGDWSIAVVGILSV